MTIENKTLKLNPKDAFLKPIDIFFTSLAKDLENQGIGIVLSGTGSDGTLGLKAIKAEGGITFAQSPDTAQYPDMPKSAISANACDFVLPPEQIAEELQKISKNPQLVYTEIKAIEETKAKEKIKIGEDADLDEIMSLLKSTYAVDFTHYKQTVVNRRISRRMVINNKDKQSEYKEYLRRHPNELESLYNDMLIGVTNFFREPETFTALKETVFPELVKNHSPKEPIRIWVPGCSTGEEPYSFAIAIQEYLEENAISGREVQIFGTDVNDKNVERARQGVYSKTIETDVSEVRLKRFFIKSNGNYQVTKVIRDMCVFAKQDITADPPFSNLDLISCRNMLIYFDENLHERIVPLLHYALKLGGFLVLGASESIRAFANLFEPINRRGVIFKKKRAQPRVTFGLQAQIPYLKYKEEKAGKKDALSVLRDEVDRLLVNEYVPATMLVNDDLDVIVFRGNISPYVLPESGLASLNLSKMVRKELRSEVQTMIYRAKKENRPVKENAVRFVHDGKQKTINIQVIPMNLEQYEEPFFLLLFEDVSSAAEFLRKTMELTFTPEGRENVKDRQNRELREELESTKQSLQTIIETQEATNEELRTTMEEAQSSNEELQSTNEELETAKEELQSSNEELKTLNDELKNRNQALAQLNDDLVNLNRNVDPAIVMVDKGLRIRLFSPSAQKILNLSPSEIGLSIASIKLSITVEALEKIISDVVTTLGTVNKEVQDTQGHYFYLRVRPYITLDDKIDGAVLSFSDVDELKKYQRLANIGETAGMVGHDIRNPLQAITGDLYLLNDELKGVPKSESRKVMEESVEAISENIFYINKIISDLQDYTRPIKPNITNVGIKELVNDTLARTSIPNKIQTEIDVEENLILKLDVTYMKRVLTNLVINAVQAMPNGGKLTIEAYTMENKAIISVKDTGVGIPETIKPNLFKPLFTTKSKGQGLGLAVVKRLIEGLNGKVGFESKEGNGTKFTIELPIN